MMMIIIILTASYIGDDVRIVYSLANTMRSFSVTDGRTNEQGDSRSRMVDQDLIDDDFSESGVNVDVPLKNTNNE